MLQVRAPGLHLSLESDARFTGNTDADEMITAQWRQGEQLRVTRIESFYKMIRILQENEALNLIFAQTLIFNPYLKQQIRQFCGYYVACHAVRTDTLDPDR